MLWKRGIIRLWYYFTSILGSMGINTIDKLQGEVTEIQQLLQDLNNDLTLSTDEKKEKTEKIKKQAEKIKGEIEEQINNLKSKTDDWSLKEKEKAETLLESLGAISVLYKKILDDTEESWTSNVQKWEQILATSEDSNGSKSGFRKILNGIWSVVLDIREFVKNIGSSWKKENSSNWPSETGFKVDKSEFSKGRYPFQWIPPYKGISAYRVDNVKIEPRIWFSQLSEKSEKESSESITLTVKKETERYTNTNAAWYKKNNPCNVSPFKGDIGRLWSSAVADWQNHAQYETMEDGLASFMRLMRTERYNNKSVRWRNCSGMQWIYNPNEDKSLKALRIIWITHICEYLDVPPDFTMSPVKRINTDDPETMMAFTQAVAIRESGCHFSRATLERAYYKAFPEETLSLAA